MRRPTFWIAALCVLATWPLAWLDTPLRAVWPPVVALAVILATRHALVGLLIGGFCGAVILAGGNPWQGWLAVFADHMAPSLTSPWKTGAIAFTLVLGGFAAVLDAGGGLDHADRFGDETLMTDPTRLKNRARREEQRENWSRAIELYTEALSESQKKGNSVADLSLYNRIGDIYLRIGQKNTAVRYYEQAIERYTEQELHASAIALCNKVLRIHPARGSVYLQLGRLHLATNLLADAGVHYRRYAEAMWQLGDEQAALEGLEELIEQTGDAESVERWTHWLGMASDLEAAAARVETLRDALASHDVDADDLLAQVLSAEAPRGEGDLAAAIDESPDAEDTAVVVSTSEYETEEDAPLLPLLDELPLEMVPGPVEPREERGPELASWTAPEEPALGGGFRHRARVYRLLGQARPRVVFRSSGSRARPDLRNTLQRR